MTCPTLRYVGHWPPVWSFGLLLLMQPAGTIEPEPPIRSHRAVMSPGLVVEAIDRHLNFAVVPRFVGKSYSGGPNVTVARFE